MTPELRAVLEALEAAANMASDAALPDNGNLADAWYAVVQRCAAALADGPRAGEGTGNPPPPELQCGQEHGGWLCSLASGHKGPCQNSEDWRWRRKPPAPAPAGETASGESGDNFEAALRDYVEAAIARRGVTGDGPEYAEARGKCARARQKVLRLYRAAAGEVVGTATVWRGIHKSPHVVADTWAISREDVPPAIGLVVDLVRRRGKEEG